MSGYIMWNRPKKVRQRWFLVIYGGQHRKCQPMKAQSKDQLLKWLLEKYPENAPFEIMSPPRHRCEP